ncbi:hypothetical protein AB595_24635 [Massilia sp. WF1]|nr:hypothetical protein AB595_24635 [Massilia sp. WF1]
MNAPQPEVKEAVIKMYAAREEIHPREVKGRYASMRWACVWLPRWFYGLLCNVVVASFTPEKTRHR